MANESIRRVSTIFTIDDSEHNRKLTSINQQYRLTQSELMLAGERMKGFGSNTEDLTFKQSALEKQVSTLREKSNHYSESVERATKRATDNKVKLDDLGRTKDKLNEQYKEAVKVYGKESEQAQALKSELDKVSTEYKEQERVVNKNVDSVNRYTTEMNKTEAQLAAAKAELSKVSTELDKSQNKWLQSSEKMKEAGKKLQDVGGKLDKVGSNLNRKVSVPLAGVGLAVLKVSSDFESGMSEVQAISGATGTDLENLREKAKFMGETTKFSATESAEALKYMSMAGWETNDMLDGLEGVMYLAAASGEELGQVSDIVTDAITAFGLEAKDAGHFADVLAMASSSSNTNVGLMGETFKYVAPLAGSLGYSIEDTALAIGLMADSGVKGSRAGTALRSMLTRLVKPTKESGTAMDTLGISITNTDGTMKPLIEVMELLRGKFKDLDPDQKAFYGAQIAGQEAMSGFLAIMNSSEEDFRSLQKNIGNSTGEAKKMADIMNDNLKGELVLLKSQLEGVGIQLGEVLIPMARDGVKVVSDVITKFSELSPKTQENIVKLGLLAFAMGPVLKTGGAMVSGGGKLLKLGGNLIGMMAGGKGLAAATSGLGTVAAGAGGTAGMGALTSGLGGVIATAAPFAAGAAIIGAAGYGIYKTLSEDVIPEVDLFADKIEYSGEVVLDTNGEIQSSMETTKIKISESTKEAIGSYLELDESVKKHIDSIYINSTEITEEMKNELISQYKEMATAINEHTETKRKENIENLKDFFENTQAIYVSEQEDILEKTNEYYETRKRRTQGYEDEITKILENASKENRELTNNEKKTINSIQQAMKESAIKIMSQNELESKIILQRMKDYDTRITAEQASDHIKELNRSRDGAIKAAQEEYDKRIATIIKMRDEAGVISEEQAEKLIKDAKRQRDGIVTEAEKTRNEAVDTIFNMNRQLESNVDSSTGKIVSFWDRLFGKWDKWNPKDKNVTITTNQHTRYTQSGLQVQAYALGTSNSIGGLAQVHERGYEMIDLPAGSKVRNHLSSTQMAEDISKKTAMNVAKEILEALDTDKPVYLIMDKEKIGEAMIPIVDKGLGFNSDKNDWAQGGG